jgi:hypothetical protein
MHFDELFPNRFMKAGEFKGKDVTLKIAKILREDLEGDKGKETKAIVSFDKTPKQLVLNKTNALCLKAMFGAEVDGWVGKRVTFYPAAIEFGDNDLAIRVRGSPDLAADMTFDLKLARKKAKPTTLRKTGKPAAAPAPAEEPPPMSDDDQSAAA